MKIAISGFTGSGKTALAKALKQKIKEKGIDIVLIIPTFKDIAKSMNIDLMKFQEMAEKDHNIDKKFDEELKRMFNKERNCIAATWLAVWMLDADVKIFLSASLEQRARRIMKRDNISIEEAIKHVKERDKENRDRYYDVYGIDINKHDFVDLCINNSNLSIEQEVNLVMYYLNLKGLLNHQD